MFPVSQFIYTHSISILAAAECKYPTFLGLKPWYQYLTLKKDILGHCAVSFNMDKDIWSRVFLPIGLVIVDDLLRVGAIVAVSYVTYGGVQYVMSQGSPDKVSAAKQTIMDALIGLAICLIAIGVVSFIGRTIG